MQYARWLLGPLRRATSRGKARLVLGARQTGKSTLFQMLRRPADVFVDLQERGERLRLARDPEALTRVLLASRRAHQRVFVDEVQRVPELLDEIQLLLDRHPGRFTFTLTGSSARRLRRRDANLLPGRIHRYPLGPVCLWEQSGRESTVLRPSSKITGPAFPSRRLEEMLVLGSLPASFVEGAGFVKTLESYAETYIEEEVLREAAARNIGPYGRFLELAAVESGKPIHLTRISRESGIALSTLRLFYTVLEDTLVGFSISPFSRSGRVRILKTPRFFIFDTGVRNALARLPLDERMLAIEGGNLFEHWVACELMTRLRYLGPAYRLSFWRTTDGTEVDLIVETPREVIPLEVKYTSNPRPADAQDIERFIARYPRLARRGYVICRARRQERVSRHVLAIPWQEL
jgi:predicted AAA+ superfamily ATPase